MKRYKKLYNKICSYSNIELAYHKARKHKTLKPCVIAFEKDLKNNLILLQCELLTETYIPRPLENFVLRDPKTRKISKSDFRDRVIHHALCNIIEPIFDKNFIYDTYANRSGKGTLNAIKRFEYFKNKTTQNNSKDGYVLKADIKHYFDTVDQEKLLSILSKKISDTKTLTLIRKILENHQTKYSGKGMPLGNLTSQFFANIYLNELDQYIKHNLKIKYYIRYVDDFVIFEKNKSLLEEYWNKINIFIKENLLIELHPEKTKIHTIKKGITFLGLRIFLHHKLLAKRNIRKFKKQLHKQCINYFEGKIEYDKLYDFIEGWIAYSKTANTYNMRKRILTGIEQQFPNEISTKEYNRHLKLDKLKHY